MNVNIFKWPAFWLALYFIVLAGVGLMYLGTLKADSPLRITNVSVLPAGDDTLLLGVQGEGLPIDRPAHLVLDATNKHAIVGSMPLWGRAVDIEIVQGKAYVVSLGEGVEGFDLSDPVDPQPSDRFSSRASSWRGDADEDFFYLSSMLHGISIYRMADGRYLANLITMASPAWSSIHRGSTLFVASGPRGIAIIDSTNPLQAREVGHLDLPGKTVDLAFLGHFLLAASSRGGIHLIDIEDIEHPRILQRIKAEKSYDKLMVIDDVLYAADADLRIDVFTFANDRLRKLSNLPTFGRVRDFLVQGDFLYVAESTFGVSKLDVSDPEHPRRVGFVGTPGEPSGLGIYQNYLYVASGLRGVQILDTALFEPRHTIAALDTPMDAMDLLVDGDWIYVADGKAGLQVVDRSDLDHLRLGANLPAPNRVKTLTKSGNVLYLVLEDKGLLVVDVSDPRAPRQMNILNLDFQISSLAVRGQTLFAGSFDKKLLAIDISSPSQPWVRQILDVPDQVRAIAVRDDTVFMAGEHAGLFAASFKPGQPGRLVGTLKRPWPMSDFSAALGIAVRGHYAYLVQGEEGVQIIDVEHAEAPREVANFYHSGRSIGIELTGDYAVLSTRWGGYFFIDISGPETPYLAAHMDSPRSTSGFKIEGDKLYASGRTNGISVLPLPLKNLSANKKGGGLSLIFPKPHLSGWYTLSLKGNEKGGAVSSVVRIE